MKLKMSKVTRSILFVCLIDGVVGMSFGASAVNLGVELWIPFVLSVIVLAGASEFLFVSVIAAGGSPFTAALAGLLVNARHLPFGVSVKNEVGTGKQRLLGCHLMNDESVAFALAQSDSKARKQAYWLCGLGIIVCWPLGILVGGLFGDLITHPEHFGLDALFPSLMLALVIPNLSTINKKVTAFIGALMALVTTPFLPVGLPVLLSVSALFFTTKNAEKGAKRSERV
ncbi:AzlC family ABC transporter permease [Marinomonas sp. GJ51-6]|uniref:AzlC family ABC transporter permease n=1 Tax=Marinomonas sp. GJ51-6 TaxID=2992802 RepID=UPI0029348A2D|nr:AzlC family ABC transporter permease [Marinomonas sp. GJ51-6]WOD08580.1 AzlC family ABC transporter permease [Marinomonas sp. GJ51-6]